ncbi:putative siderophore esteraselike protein [Diaporthe ampelina]|uniref:Putative siderophore esteraselike protein n=1 Tax=Diaporthe ampelina TaxID=1214573 RepID=A0A0G2FKQ6_9PEZI|nr:putative siderophore esteraselike protein [Diaporthe ampelina]
MGIKPPVFEPVQDAHAPNTCQSVARTHRGDFLVQVAWPLKWNQDRTIPEDEKSASESIPSIYLTDGNAYFSTTVDVVRRLEYTHKARCIVIGVGYPMPPARAVYDFRRGPDLTPPSRDGTYDAPLGRDGKPRTDIQFGEADDFLAFIREDVMRHYVEGVLFPHLRGKWGHKALLGHSYGGIFTLNALYTQPGAWDTYLAASADVEFNKGKFVAEQEADFRARTLDCPSPALLITYGEEAQDMVRRPGESDVRWEKRRGCAELPGTREAVEGLVQRFEGHPNLRRLEVTCKTYRDAQNAEAKETCKSPWVGPR